MSEAMRRTIVFFQERDGTMPVVAWLNSLSTEVRAKVAAYIEMLAEHGATLDFPFTSQIEGKLRELRLRVGKTRYRILYFFDPKQVGVLLHGFTKSSAEVPSTDKNLGLKRMEIHLSKDRTGIEGRKKR